MRNTFCNFYNFSFRIATLSTFTTNNVIHLISRHRPQRFFIRYQYRITAVIRNNMILSVTSTLKNPFPNFLAYIILIPSRIYLCQIELCRQFCKDLGDHYFLRIIFSINRSGYLFIIIRMTGILIKKITDQLSHFFFFYPGDILYFFSFRHIQTILNTNNKYRTINFTVNQLQSK